MSKIKSFMGKFKKYIFIYLVVWIILAILLVAPVAYTFTEARLNGTNWIEEMTLHFVDNFLKFPIMNEFEQTYMDDFIKAMEIYSIAYWIMVFIGIYKSLPKSDFENIEHGSSDWCLPGEQYSILSKKQGLILAKDNYLPIDKKGNINVLIVGRFWFW